MGTAAILQRARAARSCVCTRQRVFIAIRRIIRDRLLGLIGLDKLA